MKPIRALLYPLTFVFATETAIAGCKTLNATAIIEFGQASIGEKLVKLDKKTINAGCLKPVSPGYFDCEAVDSSGVAYLIEGNEIIRKEIRGDGLQSVRLPLGISVSDGLYEVLVKSKKADKNFPEWGIAPEKDGAIVLQTDYCFKEKNNSLFSVYIGFDKAGRIEKIGTRLNWN